MRIIVTFAVQAEFAPWRRLRTFKRIGKNAFLMRDGGTEIHVLITGIGARQFKFPMADLCVASGVAGSLKKEHGVGTILVAKASKREDSNETTPSDDSLIRTAMQCGATRVDFFCTANSVVSSPSEKSRLGRIADAVDMESYSIMAEAERHHIPAVAIRAISDTADQSLPLDFSRAIDEDGKIDWLPALAQVAASPRSLPGLMRFGFESSRAARKLAHFLDRYLRCLMTEADLFFDRASVGGPASSEEAAKGGVLKRSGRWARRYQMEVR
jgi:nucleoside phosphorylase